MCKMSFYEKFYLGSIVNWLSFDTLEAIKVLVSIVGKVNKALMYNLIPCHCPNAGCVGDNWDVVGIFGLRRDLIGPTHSGGTLFISRATLVATFFVSSLPCSFHLSLPFILWLQSCVASLQTLLFKQQLAHQLLISSLLLLTQELLLPCGVS